MTSTATHRMPKAIAHSAPQTPDLIRDGAAVSLVSVFVAHLLLEGIAVEGLDLLGLLLLLILGLIIELVIA